jgi:hypothetical protein
MKKIFILVFFFHGLTGNLFPQHISVSGNKFLQPSDGFRETTDGPANDSISYYDLGGHLFAGQYPINNPFSTGDTGIVYLYRVKGTSITPVDTTRFYNLGYFIFPHLPEGTYLLKARLTSYSSNFTHYFPTYLATGIQWNYAERLELKDRSIYEANINMIRTSDTITGDASIKGYVVQESPGQIFKPMANTEVILFNEQLTPVTYCISDKDGLFYFPDLPYGTYNLMAESTGRYPAPLKITLDENHNSFDSLMVEAMIHNPATIEEQLASSGNGISPVFPNPASDKISIIIKSKETENFNFSVFSLTGERVFSANQLVSGIRTVTLPVENLSEGIYFLKVTTRDGTVKSVQKWFKI